VERPRQMSCSSPAVARRPGVRCDEQTEQKAQARKPAAPPAFWRLTPATGKGPVDRQFPPARNVLDGPVGLSHFRASPGGHPLQNDFFPGGRRLAL